MNETVFVNRTLNLKKIQHIGFDMDHTLVRYNSHNFEELAHKTVLTKLVQNKHYPEAILNFPFEYNRSIRGLVLDRVMGNILKLNRYSGIRLSTHGTKPIDFPTQKKLYKSIYIDLSNTTSYSAIDTTFSVSFALLFAQLIDFKDTSEGEDLPVYEQISRDLDECLDEAHRDGSLKNEVRRNLSHFIIPDPDMVAGLERYRKHGKKLFVLTNSYFDYTKLLLDYAITPYLKNHSSWLDLFEFVITAAGKPRFFWDNLPFLRINPDDGTMLPYNGPLEKGVYYGGCATAFTKKLGLSGEDILYIGDHIYGDILRLKKDCNWRTGLVVEELEDEIKKNKSVRPLDLEINQLMDEKDPFERELLKIATEHKEFGTPIHEPHYQGLQKQVGAIDQKISALILKRQDIYNPYWGEVMRIGNEESFFAYQVERYACIYMSQLGHLLEYSPRTYFRAHRRMLAHEEPLT